MTGFTPDWLRLREPLDSASRDGSLVEWLPHVTGTRQVVDLGAGTGANLRFLAPLLGGAQEWLLVDDDAGVLEAADPAFSDWASNTGARMTSGPAELLITAAGFECRVRRRRLDLAAELHTLPLSDHGLVTCSALLDLVSATWLHALADRCRRARATVLFASTYDGRTVWTPEEPGDARMLALVNAHQTTDKGFGPALGPAAAPLCARLFRELGYEVVAHTSDWRMGPGQRAPQSQLLDGWLDAALQMAPENHHATLTAWRARRREHVEQGRSSLTVGHIDLAARLP